MLDALGEIGRFQRPNEIDAVVADTHELHPEALAHPRAIVPLPRDLGLVPRAGLLFAGQDLADAAGESTLLGLDQMADALVGAPLLFVVVPAAIGVKGCELGLDERTRRLEILGDLIGRELGRRGHVTSCGALRMGIFTLSTTLPSARDSCGDSPWRSSGRSLRRMADWSSPAGGRRLPALCRWTARVSSLLCASSRPPFPGAPSV